MWMKWNRLKNNELNVNANIKIERTIKWIENIFQFRGSTTFFHTSKFIFSQILKSSVFATAKLRKKERSQQQNWWRNTRLTTETNDGSRKSRNSKVCRNWFYRSILFSLTRLPFRHSKAFLLHQEDVSVCVQKFWYKIRN